VSRLLRRTAAVLLSLATLGCDDPRLGDGDATRLEAQGGEIRTSLEAYFAQHARYPATLREAGLDSAAAGTEFGPWEYGADSLGARYRLRVGDRGKHGFALVWDAERQAWSWDR
jgi:hypothetical protein